MFLGLFTAVGNGPPDDLLSPSNFITKMEMEMLIMIWNSVLNFIVHLTSSVMYIHLRTYRHVVM